MILTGDDIIPTQLMLARGGKNVLKSAGFTHFRDLSSLSWPQLRSRLADHTHFVRSIGAESVRLTWRYGQSLAGDRPSEVRHEESRVPITVIYLADSELLQLLETGLAFGFNGPHSLTLQQLREHGIRVHEKRFQKVAEDFASGRPTFPPVQSREIDDAVPSTFNSLLPLELDGRAVGVTRERVRQIQLQFGLRSYGDVERVNFSDLNGSLGPERAAWVLRAAWKRGVSTRDGVESEVEVEGDRRPLSDVTSNLLLIADLAESGAAFQHTGDKALVKCDGQIMLERNGGGRVSPGLAMPGGV